jgi:hypothetical protein
MTIEDIQRKVEREAEKQAAKYVDDWVSKQTIFYNQVTLMKKENYIPGFKSGGNYLAPEIMKLVEALIDINQCGTRPGLGYPFERSELAIKDFEAFLGDG